MPQSDYKVNITLATKDKTSGPAKTATSAISKLGKAAAIAAAAFGALKAAQGALNFLKTGAAVEATEKRFVAFSGGVENAKGMLAAFNKATDNTVTKQAAMASVSKLLQMGLVKNSDEMATMASIAIKLGDQTKSAGDRIADFSLLLANRATQRLDNFGIAAGKARTRVEELTKAGMDVDQAFKTAVMEEGAKALATLGDTSGLAATKIEAISARLTDLKDSAALAAIKLVDSTGVLEKLSEVVDQLPGYFIKAGDWIIKSAEDVTIAGAQMFGMIKAGVTWVYKFVESGFKAKVANEAFKDSMLKTAESVDKIGKFFDKLNTGWEEYKKSVTAASEETQKAAVEIATANAVAAGTATGNAAKGTFIRTQLAKMRPMQEQMRAAGSSWAFINEQMAKYQENTFRQAEQLYGKEGANPTFVGNRSGSSVSNNSNTYNFNQTVNTQATTSNVMGDFALAAALAR